jgi:hypothetical protein
MLFSTRLRLALGLGCLAVVLAGFAIAAPTAASAPKILSAAFSVRDVRPGDSITGQVQTTPDVGYVEARIGNYNAAFTRTGTGKFSFAYTVPKYLAMMPWFKHARDVQIIARSVTGVEVRKSLPVTLR